MVNLSAILARAAFEADLAGPEFRGPMLNSQRVAGARIDAHMRQALAADLHRFQSTAADELARLDGTLQAIAEGLRSALFDLLDARPESPVGHASGSGASKAADADTAPRLADAPWFKRLPEAAAERAARTVEDVQVKAGTTLFETSGAADRMRKAAARRLQEAWIADDSSTLLGRVILLIDQTAYAARMSLS